MLDNFQMDVVKSNNNLLVIAGPGSGKTTTILSKINYLIEKGYKDNILVLSFTNKSVNDIKERLNEDVFVTTFHKLAIDILNYQNIPYKIIDSSLLDYIIYEYFKRFTKSEINKLCIYLNIASLRFKSPEYISFATLIKTFINLFKTNNKDITTIYKLMDNFDDKYLLKIILDIFLEYEEEKKSTNSMDFDDLIIKSTNYLKENYNYKKFKYIIIDEFQDTSKIRLDLIKVIYDNSASIITCVGDDAQSIFHFSGCDLNIFLNFDKYFPNVKKIFLKNTYRNSQNMITITENFINKNKYQLIKNMQSKVPNNNPIEIVKYLNSKTILTKILDKINSNDILIISRNKYDINRYLNKDITFDGEFIYYKDFKYKYMTIHSSKGLEEKYVIILNVSDSILGLPNKIEDHPILNFVNDNNFSFPYAEERRVFFVALTRAKEKVFVLTPYDNPSIFIKEIKKDVIRTSLK